ncbi:MAG TPA: CRISPR-associated endonuclease Cas1 [Candidatus Micrarchaeia archaeon]|nr:CRISPR-associated endonuclease Cas1 [Candidatus Micrarchaeia archaeon]
MRLLTTLYVTDHRATIGVRSGTILVKSTGGAWERVPIEALEAVVIASHAEITSDALAICADKGIHVTSLARSGRVRFNTVRGARGNVLLRWRQFRAADDPVASLAIARVIVAGKLGNAERALRRWVVDAPIGLRRSLRRLGSTVRDQAERVWSVDAEDRLRGCEGNGTRAYFEAVGLHLQLVRPDLSFERRTRRPPRDPVNATLSYCYGLVLGDVSGALEGVGLDPQIGFLHELRPGRPALALDLLEEFRPALADRFAIALLARRVLGEAAFTETPGGGCYLSDVGRGHLLEAWDAYRSEEITHPLLARQIPRSALAITQATLMARHLRGDLPAYPPYMLPM